MKSGNVAFGTVDSGPARLRRGPAAPPTTPPFGIPGRWRLEIDGRSVTLDRLVSWADREEFRYFSGTAVYRADFDWHPPSPRKDVSWCLSLGRVHEIADVELNGKPAGVAWMVPYRLDVSAALAPGTNRLRIRVTNLLINRVLGQPDPDVRELIAKFGRRMGQTGDRPDLKFAQNPEKSAVGAPVPSGLLAPVEILRR